MESLQGKVAVITGAASGIGRALAERCVQIWAMSLQDWNWVLGVNLWGDASHSCRRQSR